MAPEAPGVMAPEAPGVMAPEAPGVMAPEAPGVMAPEAPGVMSRSAPSVRIATYNIHHGAASGQCVDHRALVSAIRSLDAEVIGLQEVDQRVVRSRFVDQTSHVARSLGRRGVFGPSRWLLGGRAGNALITTSMPRDVEVLRLPRSAGGEGRSAILAMVDTSVGSLTVGVAHLQNSPSAAEHQLDVLIGRMDERVNGPAVLLGDFNLHPGLVLPRLEPGGWNAVDVPPTFPSHAPDQRIDWIVLRGLRADAVEVPDLRSSDHRPAVVTARMGRIDGPTS